jgi:hypothetical protein
MKQEMRWGTAVVIAVAAAAGIASRSSGGPRDGAGAGQQIGRKVIQSKASKKSADNPCRDLVDLFENFLPAETITEPAQCGDTTTAATNRKDADFRPNFIIATLPDPLHTHFALLFDRFVEAIQEGGQDEGYEYDSSWLPWETEEPSLALLSDQDEAEDRKENREDQPGVLLFRKSRPTNPGPRAPYQEGLIIFVVGEEPTGGIHRKQFNNAVAWIAALEKDRNNHSPVAILGPTFSGSFPSLAQLLANNQVSNGHGLNGVASNPLAIYSGSATSKEDGTQFNDATPGIIFHSFLQDDKTTLNRFCAYLEWKRTDEEKARDLEKVAVLSEDETAYGYNPESNPLKTGSPPDKTSPCGGATWLYYPRDISTLRAAYQSQSIFNSGSSTQQNQDTQRKNLATDLADPAGKEHDTVRTYAGNQIPLSQEAELLGIVAALRSHQAHYVVLRSSNTLDPLFLTNFLRRNYPEGRAVILNADLLFQRGQDALELSGAMTLFTYPLIPWERNWTARPPFLPYSHRVFPEATTEGTYIASRLLLQSPMFSDVGCTLRGGDVFLPSLFCRKDALSLPIPDYASPFWTEAVPYKAGEPNQSCKPATWLSVITKNGSWPLAALNDHTLPQASQDKDIREAPRESQTAEQAQNWPRFPMPLSMKLFLVLLIGFSLFHLWCCGFASFTAKPAFLAHFATYNRRHQALILMGSFLTALMALITGWGCGVFSAQSRLFPKIAAVRFLVLLVWGISGLSMLINLFVTRSLNEDAANRHRGSHSDARFRGLSIFYFVMFGLLTVAFILLWVGPFEDALILANRALVYWRSMNLVSGVSPIVPFLSLTSGLYLWFWYSLHGLALFGPDRPRLPPRVKLIIDVQDKDKNPAKGRDLDVLPMFSQECAAKPAEEVATPLAWQSLGVTLVLFLVFWILVVLVAGEVPIRSLGARTFARTFCLWLDFCFSLVLATAWQLWRTWSGLRQLLVFLDRLPLRRTLEALHGFSWGSVWKMSGNVLDVRYKLVSRQLECLNHLHASLQEAINCDPDMENDELKGVDDCLTALAENQKAGVEFAKWYSVNYRNPRAAGLQRFEEFQEQIAATAGLMLTHLLVPAWRKEEHSLILVSSRGSDQDERKQSSPESLQEYIRNAEELVCLTYLGFAQNMLGRIRTMVIAALGLFVAATLSASTYPFDPRPVLSGVLFVLLIVVGTVVVLVYAGMHRDATLSHVTNTNPGELGSEFWFKLVGYGAVPLLGLITTMFPELPGFLFSWLQPGITSLK